MFKSEKGIGYVNWIIIVIVSLFFAALIIRVLVGENGLIQQRKEEAIRNQSENNIIIELTNQSN
ncbi:MAG: hypothetical protein J6J36_04535 [Clostridia bacterium]|nr:hypothetical protein [Clostridia bacterium]